MGLRENLDVLRRRWLSVAVVTVLSVTATGVLSMLATPVYTARASLFFSLDRASTVNEIAQGATFTREQMTSYASLATTPAVLDQVIEALELDTDVRTLAGQVSASTADGTVILDVAVSDPSPERAAEVANAVSATLTHVVEGIGPQEEGARPLVRGTVVQAAVAPRFPSSPNTRLNLIAGLVGGLLLGVALALAREGLDTRVRGARELRLVTDAPILGRITRDVSRSTGPVVLRRSRSPEAEQYRQLASNTQFLQAPGRSLSMVVSSAASEEGKSTVAVNLALALAEVSGRVLLVDADLRRPAVAGRLGLEDGAGLSTVLAGRARFGDVVQRWGPRGLSVLTSGMVPPNPTQLLSSHAMATLTAELAERFDVVVYDTPPLLSVTDALLLSRSSDGLILVANTGRIRRPQLEETLEAIGRADARLLGFVLNMLPPREQVPSYGEAADRTAKAGGSSRWLLMSHGVGGAAVPDARTSSPAAGGTGTGSVPRSGDLVGRDLLGTTDAG